MSVFTSGSDLVGITIEGHFFFKRETSLDIKQFFKISALAENALRLHQFRDVLPVLLKQGGEVVFVHTKELKKKSLGKLITLKKGDEITPWKVGTIKDLTLWFISRNDAEFLSHAKHSYVGMVGKITKKPIESEIVKAQKLFNQWVVGLKSFLRDNLMKRLSLRYGDLDEELVSQWMQEVITEVITEHNT